MGCTQSKIENEEAVSRCKDRKQFMKEALAARNAFAAAHSAYAMALKNTGAALSDYAHGEVQNPSQSGPPSSSLPSSASPATIPQSSVGHVVVDPFLPPPPPPLNDSFPAPPPPLDDNPAPPLHRTISAPEIKISQKASSATTSTIIEEEDGNVDEEDDMELENRERLTRKSRSRKSTTISGGGSGSNRGKKESDDGAPPPPVVLESREAAPTDQEQQSLYHYLFPTVENMPGTTLEEVGMERPPPAKQVEAEPVRERKTLDEMPKTVENLGGMKEEVVEKAVEAEKVAVAAVAGVATQEQSDMASALNLLDAALALSPRFEVALELKARSLLYLRRFREVADMLQDYIPSLKMANEDSGSVSSDNSSTQLSRERVKLLSSNNSSSDSPGRDPSFKCFSVSDLKKKVMAGLCKNCEKEGQWRYLVLGQACCHLGLMEDAMVLLQTGKRLATAAFRRESICLSDDSFSLSNFAASSDISSTTSNQSPAALAAASAPPRAHCEWESVNQLLGHIKLLLRRRAAALAALDAGLYSEAIRHFSKIVDGRRGSPQGFLAECYLHRASAYRSAGRIAESIADCNRTLALDPSCIQALDIRASLLETIRCLPDSLHDLEHLKLLYNSILRDRKLPGPAWKRHNVRYREIPGKLCALTSKIQQLKQRVASGETGNVDYYALIGLRRGCSRSELERAHLLLVLKHKPDKATSFIDRCEFSDDRDLDSVRDRAKMSALLLYRLIQKGYSNIMTNIMEEEAAEKQRKKAAAALQAAQAAIQVQQSQITHETNHSSTKSSEFQAPNRIPSIEKKAATTTSNTNAFQGVFCRDLAAVGSLLAQVGFNRPLPVKFEALSC